MSSSKPTIDEFKLQIESIYGKSLNAEDHEIAEDFWHYWDHFYRYVIDEKIKILVDMLQLSYNNPIYARDHSYKIASKLIIVFGIFNFLIYWHIGSSLIILSLLLYGFGVYIKRKDRKIFHDSLILDATQNPNVIGFAQLCAHYIKGNIKLSTSNGSAVNPQLPSNAVTGNINDLS
ncbi:MAG: hypothetical protein V5B78_09535 [Desulfohalobiaceae bacterium]